MLSRTLPSTARRTSSRLVAVRPAVITSIDSKNRVRRRSEGTRPGLGEMMAGAADSVFLCKRSAHELVPDPMHGPEVHRTGRIAFQLLPQFQDVIVHRAGR